MSVVSVGDINVKIQWEVDLSRPHRGKPTIMELRANVSQINDESSEVYIFQRDMRDHLSSVSLFWNEESLCFSRNYHRQAITKMCATLNFSSFLNLQRKVEQNFLPHSKSTALNPNSFFVATKQTTTDFAA